MYTLFPLKGRGYNLPHVGLITLNGSVSPKEWIYMSGIFIIYLQTGARWEARGKRQGKAWQSEAREGAVLFCAVLFCGILCCGILCCAMLCYAVLYVLCCAILCCTVLCCAVLCCVVLRAGKSELPIIAQTDRENQFHKECSSSFHSMFSTDQWEVTIHRITSSDSAYLRKGENVRDISVMSL